MERGEIQAALGASLFVILFILTFGFANSRTKFIPFIIFFGLILCASLFAYSISTTQVKWVRITSKAFFLLPLLVITVCFVALLLNYVNLKEFFEGFLWDGLIILIILLVMILAFALIFWVNSEKNIFLKVITWVVGFFVYSIIAFFAVITTNPLRS
jgi:hypothetical protein